MKSYHPTTPSRRHMTTLPYRKYITASEPYKSLTHGMKRDMGRNSQGRITVRHKGGGNKKLYRAIDFLYDKKNMEAVVKTIEYDPFRTGFVALVQYLDGERRYILAPKTFKVGDKFIVGENAPVKAGNRLPLKKIPAFVFRSIQYLKTSRLLKLTLIIISIYGS